MSSIIFNGRAHYAKRDAMLEVVNNQLVVSNLSHPADGVIIDTAGVSGLKKVKNIKIPKIMNTNRFLLIISAVFCFSIQTVSAQWYVGGGLGYTTENTVSLLHFSPEAGYSFHPRWTVGISTSLINVSKDVTTAESQTERKSVFYWYLNPYVRFNFFQMDRLSLFADATGNFDANHGFDVIYIGLRPGISYQLTDCFTAVAHIGFIGSYNHELRAEVGLNNLEFSLYYLFDKKK